MGAVQFEVARLAKDFAAWGLGLPYLPYPAGALRFGQGQGRAGMHLASRLPTKSALHRANFV
ncbi:hypothetical protein D3C72_1842260 [compost metagenome]